MPWARMQYLQPWDSGDPAEHGSEFAEVFTHFSSYRVTRKHDEQAWSVWRRDRTTGRWWHLHRAPDLRAAQRLAEADHAACLRRSELLNSWPELDEEEARRRAAFGHDSGTDPKKAGRS